MKKLLSALAISCALLPLTASASGLVVLSPFAAAQNEAVDIAIGPDGNIYTANSNGTVSKITPAGTATTLASGLGDANALAFDSAGNLYVAGASIIEKITPGGIVSTFSNTANVSVMAMDSSNDLYVYSWSAGVQKITSAGAVSNLNVNASDVNAMAFDSAGNLYLSRYSAGTVVKITPSGASSVFASGFNAPDGLIFDASGNLYVAVWNIGSTYKVTPAGVVSVFASVGGNPRSMAFDASGNLFVANSGTGMIYAINPSGTATLLSGSVPPYQIEAFARAASGIIYAANTGFVSQVLPSGAASVLAYLGIITHPSQTQIATDAAGNIYVPGGESSSIAKVTPAGSVSEFAYLGSNGYPFGITSDPSGNLYTANYGSNTISKITPAGAVSNFANLNYVYPDNIVSDSSGNLYVLGIGSGNITRVSSAGVVTTITTGGSYLHQQVFDASGNLYVSDTGTDKIFKVNPAGIVSTFAALSGYPSGLTFDSAGNLYVGGVGTVWKISPSGVVSTYASGLGSYAFTNLVFDNLGNLYAMGIYSAFYLITPAGNAIQLQGLGTFSAALAKDPSGHIYSFVASDTFLRKFTPGCSVVLTPSTIAYGSSATLSYASAVYGSGPSFYINNAGYMSANTSSSFTVAPLSTTDYTGTVSNSENTNTCPATLTVTPPPAPTATITSSSASILVGQSVTVTAKFTPGSADVITADNIDQPVGTGLAADTSPGTKTITFTPAMPGTYTFYARATTGYYGSWATYAQTTVTVTAAPSCSVTVTPSTIAKGNSASILYVSQNATGFSINTVGSETPDTAGQITVSPSASADYTGTATAGGVTSTCPAHLSVSCTPSYTCSGQTIEHTDASCVTTGGPTCMNPSYCSAGSSSCVVPPISFGTSGNLRVSPSLAPNGGTVRLFWSVTNAASCAVAGDNGDSWTGLSSPAAGAVSSAIMRVTQYTLTCIGLAGAVPPSVTQTVKVSDVPSYNEH